MRTVTKIYKEFKELTEEQQQEVVEYISESQRYGELYYNDYVVEHVEEQLQEMGFSNVKIYYSGFYSQGDGLMFEFTCNAEDVMDKNPSYFSDEVKDLFKKYDVSVYVNGVHSGHYYHSKCVNMTFTFEYGDNCYDEDNNNLVQNVLLYEDDFEEEFTDLYEDVCQDQYKYLERHYEEYFEREQVEDYLINTEKEFEVDEEGTLKDVRPVQWR